MKSLQEMTDEELWQLFPVILRKHNPAWAEWYADEKKVILEHIGTAETERISHIGSTAVPGLIAKPTVDILLEISEEANLPDLRNRLENRGYLFSEQPGNPPPHMMFMKGYIPAGFAEKVFHLHIRYFGNWDELYFRDYLISNPEEAARYGALKQRLQIRFRHNRDGYTRAKTDYIRRITARAREVPAVNYGMKTDRRACALSRNNLP